jgi:hypothetical protein
VEPPVSGLKSRTVFRQALPVQNGNQVSLCSIGVSACSFREHSAGQGHPPLQRPAPQKRRKPRTLGGFVIMSRDGLEPSTIGLKVESGGSQAGGGPHAGGDSPDLGKVHKVDKGQDPPLVHFRARLVNFKHRRAHLSLDKPPANTVNMMAGAQPGRFRLDSGVYNRCTFSDGGGLPANPVPPARLPGRPPPPKGSAGSGCSSPG